MRTTPAPEALFSPRALARVGKQLSGSSRAPIGERKWRAYIKSGELPAMPGPRPLVRWSDAQALIERLARTVPLDAGRERARISARLRAGERASL